MKPSNPRSLRHNQHQSARHQQRQASRRRHRQPSAISTFFRVPRMPAVFNIVRACIYSAVVLWTIICLAIAVHFQGLLASSDLTHFVPFAIFVCSASLLIFLSLLAFSFRNWFTISTRVELACLGLGGTFWIALGAFLASSDSEEAEVECFASETDSTLIDMPGFSTETYHAQYRVLEAFALFNAILIWGFLLFLLYLALQQHRYGKKDVWFTPVTSYPWFGKSSNLPAPVTARNRGRSQSRGRSYGEKAGASRQTSRRDESKWNPTHKPPARAHTGGRDRHDKYHRGASPRR